MVKTKKIKIKLMMLLKNWIHFLKLMEKIKIMYHRKIKEMILLNKIIKVVYRVSFNLIKSEILEININQLNKEFNLVVIRKVHINNRCYYRLRKVLKKLIDKNKEKNKSRSRNKHKNKKIRRIKFVIKLTFNVQKKMFQLQEGFKSPYS